MSLSRDERNAQAPTAAAGAVLRRARLRSKWTQRRLAHEVQVAARRVSIASPTLDSLQAMISRWEHGHQIPDETNRRLLCMVLNLDLKDLGLPIDDDIVL